MNAARTIARFALGLHDLPSTVEVAARLHFLDALGVGLAAAAGRDQAAWGAAIQRSDSAPATCLLGSRAGPADAAMVNGALIHSLEFDDTHVGSVIHGSAVAAPAALALAEGSEASGREMLLASVIAWEVMIRIGLAAPGAFQARGFQVTSIAGALGSAAAAARIRGLDEERTIAALGIAGSQASGLLAFLQDGSSVKALNPGWAAATGLRAADLAVAGMTGPADILEGRFGAMESFAGEIGDLDTALGDLGETWHLPDAAFKLYPCCHYIHPFLEALETLLAEGLTADDLVSMTAFVAEEQAPLIAEPWNRRQAPASGYDGKWGLAYCLALLLKDGEVGVGSFEVAPRPEVVAVARRIDWQPVTDSGFPTRFPARLQASTRDGSVQDVTVRNVKGAPGRSIPEADVVAKFKRNAERRLSPRLAEQIVGLCLDPGEGPEVVALGRLLAGAPD